MLDVQKKDALVKPGVTRAWYGKRGLEPQELKEILLWLAKPPAFQFLEKRGRYLIKPAHRDFRLVEDEAPIVYVLNQRPGSSKQKTGGCRDGDS